LKDHTLLKPLVVPYDALRTIYEGGSEVRLYSNNVSGAFRVGKRVDLLGVADPVALHEAKTLESITHDNVVPLFDVFVVEGYPTLMTVVELVMPFYEQGSICDAFSRGVRFSLGEALKLIQGALLGVGHLHEVHGIIHRDVKSSNLFLTHSMGICVGDLGVSARMNDHGIVPAFKGTHPYIPPETYVSGSLSRSADIYGLGLVLNELASGPLPYADYTVDDILRRLERGQIGPKASHLAFGPQLPPPLRRIIRKAMSKRPQDRFQNAREMREALARLKLIDWRVAVDEADHKVWEGSSVLRPDRYYRVEGCLAPKGRWKVNSLQFVTSWRRLLPELITSDPLSPEVSGLFEEIRARAIRT
jgi:eukaryotic-like serine/threonine-protein kinase